ncbi:hypothetical protein ID866_3675 [Astraeus odoratus]|nr:hypothetical protein ID866_3675 [Astraeus odoratus]
MVADPPPVIHHVESLRNRPSYYWPDIEHIGCISLDRPFRPALNLQALISLIRSKNGDSYAAVGDENSCLGEKRQLRSLASSRPSKRRKVDAQDDQGGGVYPYFWAGVPDVDQNYFFPPHCVFLPAFQWSVDICYTKGCEVVAQEDHVDEASAEALGWLEEEQRITSLVEELREVGPIPQPISLGTFYPARYLGRHLAALGSSYPSPWSLEHRELAGNKWLLLLPQIDWPDAIPPEELGLYGIQTSAAHEDFLTACLAFQGAGRAKVETDLELHILPLGSYDPLLEMPFRLRAKFHISLATPNIYEPLPAKASQRNILSGLQRRIISLLVDTPLHGSPSAKLPKHVEQEVGDVTIPFFLGILRPAPALAEGVVDDHFQPDSLYPTLLPFQKRTVSWLLNREGMQMTQDGTVVSRSQFPTENAPLPPFWVKVNIGRHEFFFNRLTGTVSPGSPEMNTALGGILAEEPGLGKTIECIALMLLNPAPDRNPSTKRWDPEAKLYVKEIKTTLIVTPPALAQQWADELATHAPSLKVLMYEGWSKVGVPITAEDVELERERCQKAKEGNKLNRKRKLNKNAMSVDRGTSGTSTPSTDVSEDVALDWCAYVNQFDVCITTYNVLRLDMMVARPPPKRPRRQDVIYSNLERPCSPLVMCEWYRVIMDEVQMMGAGKSEEMVSLIPRLLSFAVSGTPAKTQVPDLIRVLRFLRIDDVIGSTWGWQLLLKHGFKDQFTAFFQRYAVRTLKSAVKNELTIPQQRRYLVGIELGRVERQVYDQALEGALAELGLDARGVAAYEGWQVDAGLLRNILRRLRGICTHPQVGQLQRQGDKLARTNVLKSMAEVLEAMRDQHWRNLMDDRKAKITALVRLAQLQQHNEQDRDRYHRALEHLNTAERDANELIAEVKAAIAQHQQKGDALKKEARTLRETRERIAGSDSSLTSLDKGKEKETARDPSPLSDEGNEDDMEDRGLPKTLAGEEHRTKRNGLQQRLRECNILLHKVKFLQGDVYHVLGPSHSEKEDACYGAADALRKDILKPSEESAARAMLHLRVDETARGVTEELLHIPLPYFEGGGIRSTRLFDEANEMIDDQLNEQATLIWQWRTKIITLLTQKLNNSGDPADGEEYSRTLDTQGEAEVYMQAYSALVADRREVILAERTLLAAHDSREKKKRQTKAAFTAATQAEQYDDIEMLEDIELKPQDGVLHEHLNEQRRDLRLRFTGRALRSILVNLSAVVTNILRDNDPETIIAKEGLTRLRDLIGSQTTLMDKLDADLAQLRKTFNERITYFRQLQDISDSVVDVAWEGSVREAMKTCETECTDMGNKITSGRARQRYLDNMTQNQQDDSIDDDDKACILCRCDFIRGFMTPCAHAFCESPSVRLERNELQRFTIQDEVPPPQKPIMVNGEPVPMSRREIEYNMIESEGSYGNKIQTLVRHLLHIQIVDPGAKSIVFSAWADSLHIIEHALLHNDTVEKNILDLAARQGLSLYTKDNSAGSIDVTCFATDSKKSLIDSNKADKKNQPAYKGDFISKVDDMLAILFPHMFEDVEYLIPPDGGSLSSNVINSTSSIRHAVHINAEAGPSRLPM